MYALFINLFLQTGQNLGSVGFHLFNNFWSLQKGDHVEPQFLSQWRKKQLSSVFLLEVISCCPSFIINLIGSLGKATFTPLPLLT